MGTLYLVHILAMRETCSVLDGIITATGLVGVLDVDASE
jgi:hypothetical protein